MGNFPKVILTGSGGRIGRAIRAFAPGRWTLHAFSRAPREGMLPLDALLQSLGPLGVDALIHCAWSTVPASAERDPGSVEREDLSLVRRLITRLQTDPAPPLVVFMSTGAVYGSARDCPSREEDLPAPIGEYARGKLAAEELWLGSGLPACALRVGNVYAIASRPDDAQGVVGRLIRCALDGSPFERWGGDSVKDYLHRDDFLAALDRLLQRRITGVRNLGSGRPTRLSELITLVETHAGEKIAVVPKPAALWDVADNRIDSGALQAQLDWSPRVPLEEGVAREVAQFRAALNP